MLSLRRNLRGSRPWSHLPNLLASLLRSLLDSQRLSLRRNLHLRRRLRLVWHRRRNRAHSPRGNLRLCPVAAPLLSLVHSPRGNRLWNLAHSLLHNRRLCRQYSLRANRVCSLRANPQVSLVEAQQHSHRRSPVDSPQ